MEKRAIMTIEDDPVYGDGWRPISPGFPDAERVTHLRKSEPAEQNRS